MAILGDEQAHRAIAWRRHGLWPHSVAASVAALDQADEACRGPTIQGNDVLL